MTAWLGPVVTAARSDRAGNPRGSSHTQIVCRALRRALVDVVALALGDDRACRMPVTVVERGDDELPSVRARFACSCWTLQQSSVVSGLVEKSTACGTLKVWPLASNVTPSIANSTASGTAQRLPLARVTTRRSGSSGCSREQARPTERVEGDRPGHELAERAAGLVGCRLPQHRAAELAGELSRGRERLSHSAWRASRRPKHPRLSVSWSRYSRRTPYSLTTSDSRSRSAASSIRLPLPRSTSFTRPRSGPAACSLGVQTASKPSSSPTIATDTGLS